MLVTYTTSSWPSLLKHEQAQCFRTGIYGSSQMQSNPVSNYCFSCFYCQITTSNFPHTIRHLRIEQWPRQCCDFISLGKMPKNVRKGKVICRWFEQLALSTWWHLKTWLLIKSYDTSRWRCITKTSKLILTTSNLSFSVPKQYSYFPNRHGASAKSLDDKRPIQGNFNHIQNHKRCS